MDQMMEFMVGQTQKRRGICEFLEENKSSLENNVCQSGSNELNDKNIAGRAGEDQMVHELWGNKALRYGRRT